MLKDNGGIAKTADFVAAGIKKYDVAALCKEGFLERVRRGVFGMRRGAVTKRQQICYVNSRLQMHLPPGGNDTIFSQQR